MPRKCSVQGCRSNYNSDKGYVSNFCFPKNPVMRQRWMNAIGRTDWIPTKNSCVCANHFLPDDVIKLETHTSSDGSVIEIPLKMARLRENAIPCIFPDPSETVKQEPKTNTVENMCVSINPQNFFLDNYDEDNIDDTINKASDNKKKTSSKKRKVHLIQQSPDYPGEKSNGISDALKDESAAYGDYIAAKHRRYSPETRYKIEHLIANILFKADMGYFENSNDDQTDVHDSTVND